MRKQSRRSRAVVWFTLVLAGLILIPLIQLAVQQLRMRSFESDIAKLAVKLRTSSDIAAETAKFAKDHDASRDVVSGENPHESSTVISKSWNVLFPVPHWEDVHGLFTFRDSRLVGWKSKRSTTNL